MDFTSVTDIAIPEGEVTKIQDADMTVLWEKKRKLEDYTWAQIQAIGAAGTGAQYFDVGDTKTITLNGQIGDYLTLSNFSCKVFIIDFNYRGDNGIYFQGFKSLAGVDIGLGDRMGGTLLNGGEKCFNINHKVSTNYGNAGGWKGCDLRYDILGSTDVAPSGYGATITASRTGYNATTAAITSPVANTLMAALPSDLRAVLAAWTIYSDNVGNHLSSSQGAASDVTASIDYLPLLSEYEVFGVRSYANVYEQNKQTQMAYYANGNSTLKYLHDDKSLNAVAVGWWLRSAYYKHSSWQCIGASDYGGTFHDVSYSYLLSPAFRVA